MSVVIDASLTLAWYFEDEATPATDAVLDHVAELGAIAPTVWRLEIANVFLHAVRRGRVTPAFRSSALAALSSLSIQVDSEGDNRVWTTTLELAERFGLTIYDASYLELAQRHGLPLATLDSDLGRAARTSGIALMGQE